MRGWARWGALFGLGAVLGTAFDYIHVYYNVLTYAHADFHGTSLRFVPLEFGLSAVAGSVAARGLARRCPPPAVGAGRFALDFALLAVAYLATGWLNGNHALTALALVPLAVVSLATRRTGFTLAAAAAAGALGPLSEMVVHAAGIFSYTFADPVPYWLPLLWVVAAGLFVDVPLVLGVVGR
ncbi:MAG: DUF2878 family protein [Deltaproteobacteria bacterium]|nr:DUF2878 family protein [Deltaproteobacteria bacterium]